MREGRSGDMSNSLQGGGSGSGGGAGGESRVRRAKTVRSFRVVQLHDMWVSLLSCTRGRYLMWGAGPRERKRLMAEIERREDIVQDIAAGWFYCSLLYA